MSSTRSWIRRGAGTALAFVVSAVSLLAAPVSAAQAAPAVYQAGCTAPQVAVVVNFAHFGGAAERGCANYTASLTGTSLLHAAGFTTTGTADYPDTFICKINGEPDTSCADTPPTSASWSYWRAAPGATSWTHSNLGAASAHPAAGSADAWNFGDTNTAPPFSPQSVLPAAAVAAQNSSRPAPAPAQVTASAPASAPQRAAPTSSAAAGPAPTASSPVPTRDSPTTAAASDKVSSGTSRISSSSASATASVTIDNVSPSAATGAKRASSSPWPAIAGVLGVVVIAGAGGTVAWRRRRTE